MIYVECKPDQTLVQTLTGQPNRAFIHEQGKYQLMNKLKRQRNARAMVDEDPGTNQPAYLTTMQVLQDSRETALKLLSDESRGNRVVVLCPRACRQNNLVQMTSARIWQIARKDAAFLAYRVATPRHCLKSRNEFSTKCRSLYSARS